MVKRVLFLLRSGSKTVLMYNKTCCTNFHKDFKGCHPVPAVHCACRV